MPAEDKVTIDERRKYLQIQRPRYQKANRQERTCLLDEMEGITGLDHKTIIRLMGRKRSDLVRKPRRRPSSSPSCRPLGYRVAFFCD